MHKLTVTSKNVTAKNTILSLNGEEVQFIMCLSAIYSANNNPCLEL